MADTPTQPWSSTPQFELPIRTMAGPIAAAAGFVPSEVAEPTVSASAANATMLSNLIRNSFFILSSFCVAVARCDPLQPRSPELLTER